MSEGIPEFNLVERQKKRTFWNENTNENTKNEIEKIPFSSEAVKGFTSLLGIV